MSKSRLIIWREYITRVRKPSFLILSLLAPILLAIVFVVPVWIKSNNFKTVHIKVVDETNGYVSELLKSDKYVQYHIDENIEDVTAMDLKYKNSADTAVLFIPKNIMKSLKCDVYNKSHPGLYAMSKLENDITEIRKKWLVLDLTDVNIERIEQLIKSIHVVYEGEDIPSEVKLILGLSSGLLMYMLIMITGVQVMRGVMEEKISRIVEILVSSVKPIQLMYGKIIGLGLVGITQFVVMISLSISLIGAIQMFMSEDAVEQFNQQLTNLDDTQFVNQPMKPKIDLIADQKMSNKEMTQYISQLGEMAPRILFWFPLFFLAGYFLYASLFAAVGSAVDSETETQQFILPITIPIIVSIIIGMSIVESPNSDIAFWASIFPLTSPIVMVVRIPFMNMTEQWWEIALSFSLLVGAFLIATRMAAKIYKTGILMYGQKASYKNIIKWLFYKN